MSQGFTQEITIPVPITKGGTNAITVASARTNLSITGELIGVQIFTASGTYTPTSGMATYIAKAVGGGGGSGYVTCSGTQLGMSGGGQSGGYIEVRGTAADIGASKTVTIGTAGIAGTSGTPAGGNGSATTLGTLWSAGGGTGGTAGAAGAGTVLSQGGTGGGTNTITTGTTLVSIVGQSGTQGLALSNTFYPFPGIGGSNPLGYGGANNGGAATTAGQTGTGYGSGASGCFCLASASANGGAGKAGYVIIYEYS